MARGYKIICSILLAMIILAVAMLVLYFRFTYTVSFDGNGGTVYPALKVHIGEKASKPLDPLKEGSVFTGWYDENDTLFNFDSPVKKNTILKAKWQVVS